MGEINNPPGHIYLQFESTDARAFVNQNSGWFDNPWLDKTINNIRVRDSHGHMHVLTDQAPPGYNAALAGTIHAMRSYIDFPVSWLAKILRVERQTVYAWMKEATLSNGIPRAENAKRISDLITIGENWREKTGGRLSRKHAALYYKNRSLLDWLVISELQHPELLKALEVFAKMERPHELVKPLSRRLYRGLQHPDSNRERFLDASLVSEPKE